VIRVTVMLSAAEHEAIVAARPGIATDVLQGQTFYGDRALAAGLVDEMAADLHEMAAEVSPMA
jgi:hypothetical protein